MVLSGCGHFEMIKDFPEGNVTVVIIDDLLFFFADS